MINLIQTKNGVLMNYIKINYLILFYLTILLTSCKNESKQVRPFPIEYNLIKNKHYEGLHFKKVRDSILVITSFTNGYKNGTSIELNINNGNIMYSCQYKNGIANGFIYDFYPSGVLKEFGEVKNDKKTNVGLEFHDKTMKLKVLKEYNQDGYVIYRGEKDTLGNIIKEEDYR